MNAKVRETKTTALAIEKLNGIIKHMEYYYSNSPAWRDIKKDADFIESHLIELSADKKVDHARLAQKFKNLFFKENKELKEINKELKEEIKELKDD